MAFSKQKAEIESSDTGVLGFQTDFFLDSFGIFSLHSLSLSLEHIRSVPAWIAINIE